MSLHRYRGQPPPPADRSPIVRHGDPTRGRRLSPAVSGVTFAASMLEGVGRLTERARSLFVESRLRFHRKRYVLGAGASIIGICCLSVGYYILTPTTFTSRWTLILPGSGAGTSFSVESIGQASSSAASPFSSPSLSPKVIYKEIVGSDQVIDAAAASIDMVPKAFGKPQVRLIEETALMMFEIAGRTPEQARDKAGAMIEAFQRQLDTLRQDEIDRRSASVRDTIKGYQDRLSVARDAVYRHQAETGLVSADQFAETAKRVEDIRGKLLGTRASLADISAQRQSLASRLGISPKIAAAALALAADPAFVKALSERGDASLNVASKRKLFGSRSPNLLSDQAILASADVVVQQRMRSLGLRGQEEQTLLVINSKAREELLSRLVTLETQAEGLGSELAALQSAFTSETARVRTLTSAAARLEELKKSQLVAEAVFTSALARVDTTKADLYASYPIVQTLAAPTLPDGRSAPKLGLALIAAFGGSLLVTLAWTLAWMRQMFVWTRSKKESSSGP